MTKKTLALTTCLVTIAIAMQGGFALAQEVDEKKNAPPKVEMLTLKVLVLDPDDHPVEGATVRPRGLRTKVNSGSWWIWNNKRDGPLPEVLTDGDGIAQVSYPKYMQEKMEVGTLNLNVTHPDFVLFDDDRKIDDTPATAKLARGFRIAVTAVDANTGEAIKTDLSAVASVSASGKWTQKKGGMLVSPTLKPQKCILRVVQFEEGKPTKFSEQIEIDPGERSRVLLKDVELATGVRVVGTIDASVPRPVKNGHISASINRKVDSAGRGRNCWSWSDKAEIQGDGSFVFESLPQDSIVQLIAVCDGWLPGKVNKSDVLKHFPEEVDYLAWDRVFPQLFKLQKDLLEVELSMLPAKSLKVTALGPDGKPLSDVEIWCCPNQYTFNGGSRIVGGAFRSRDYMTDPEKIKSIYAKSLRYLATTDEGGEAVMNNLPDSGSPQTLGADHEDYELPLLLRDREVGFNFNENGPTEVTFKMQKKGTDVMDGSQMKAAQNAEAQLRNAADEAKKLLKGWFE